MSLKFDFEFYSPKVAIHCVIFGFNQSVLKILILKYRNTDIYGLPGGLLNENEDLDLAAKRILETKTNVKNVFLEQFGVFGKKDRINQSTIKYFNDLDLLPDPAYDFFNNRFISIGYFSLVDYLDTEIKTDDFSCTAEWTDIDNLPFLMHDHNEIVQKARENLSLRICNKSVSINLMPELFTMSELQDLHEAITGTKLTRTNFQRKMLSLDFLERIEKKFTGKAHKAPYLYRFK